MNNPITPGEILLEEYLKPMGISQNAMSRAIGVAPRAINEIVHGRRSIHRPCPFVSAPSSVSRTSSGTASRWNAIFEGSPRTSAGSPPESSPRLHFKRCPDIRTALSLRPTPQSEPKRVGFADRTKRIDGPTLYEFGLEQLHAGRPHVAVGREHPNHWLRDTFLAHQPRGRRGRPATSRSVVPAHRRSTSDTALPREAGASPCLREHLGLVDPVPQPHSPIPSAVLGTSAPAHWQRGRQALRPARLCLSGQRYAGSVWFDGFLI